MESKVDITSSLSSKLILFAIVAIGTSLYYTPISSPVLYSYNIGFFLDMSHLIGGVVLGVIVTCIFHQSTKSYFVLKALLFLLATTAALEIAQQLFSRNVSFEDWLKGYLGCVLGTTTLYAYLKSYKTFFPIFLALTLSTILISSILPAINLLLATKHFRSIFPQLDNFNSHYSHKIWHPIKGNCPITIKKNQGSESQSLVVSKDLLKCRGIKMTSSHIKWSNFNQIGIKTFSQSPKCIKMKARVFSDIPSKGIYLVKNLCIPQGKQQLFIPLHNSDDFSLDKITRLDLLFDGNNDLENVMINSVILVNK